MSRATLPSRVSRGASLLSVFQHVVSSLLVATSLQSLPLSTTCLYVKWSSSALLSNEYMWSHFGTTQIIQSLSPSQDFYLHYICIVLLCCLRPPSQVPETREYFWRPLFSISNFSTLPKSGRKIYNNDILHIDFTSLFK